MSSGPESEIAESLDTPVPTEEQSTGLLTLLPTLTPGCYIQAMSVHARDYLEHAWPANTVRAYRSALLDFKAWSGMDAPLPTTSALIAAYISDRAEFQGLAPSTLAARVAALRFAHRALGLPDPTADQAVTGMLKGIRRKAIEKGGWAPERAPPLRTADLVRAVQRGMDTNRRQELRDRALLLVGFYGAFRQSEVCRIHRHQLHRSEKGLFIKMGTSKTDQYAERGIYKALPPGPLDHCPIEALDEWLAELGEDDGPIFRGVNRRGDIGKVRLHHKAANATIRRRLSRAGVKDASSYSFHSLRSGFVSHARQLGLQDWQIMAQTGHKSAQSLNIYDRPESALEGNAVVAIMESIAAQQEQD